MLVLVMLVCIVCGYFGWAMNWKRQRDAILHIPQICDGPPIRIWADKVGDTPLLLRAVGAKGVGRLNLRGQFSDSELKELRELFPEARFQMLPPSVPSAFDSTIP